MPSLLTYSPLFAAIYPLYSPTPLSERLTTLHSLILTYSPTPPLFADNCPLYSPTPLFLEANYPPYSPTYLLHYS